MQHTEEAFNNLSYEMHKNQYQKQFDTKKLDSWKSKNTIDYWRHLRMYSNLDPFINSCPGDTWLTLGDGKYGTDANYLISKGIKNVLSTDISDTYLKIALEDGFISDFKVENAESLSFENNSFDFTLCKEAYHHFPRPMIALYEMIRVSRKAVILIEPFDVNIMNPSQFKIRTFWKFLFKRIKHLIKLIIGKKSSPYYGTYEEVGNFVFTLSEREIEKVALGLNLRMVSFKYLNDYYLNGVEFEEANNTSALFKKIKKEISLRDRKLKLGIRNPDLLIAIIHKSPPSDEILIKLEKKGFINKRLPGNPYIK